MIVTDQIERVGVLGCGLMGSGIAEVCARAGSDIVVVEYDDVAIAHGRALISASLDRGLASGKLTAGNRDAMLDRITFTTEIQAFHDRQLVIEAVPEIVDLKLDAFRRIDTVVQAEDAVLASNTSSLSIGRLAAVTSRPERVLGMHFFNPVPVLKLVEIVSSLRTSDAIRARAEAYVGRVVGKKVIRAQDRAGFVVNALLMPYLLSAIRMLEGGFASAEDIDAGMVEGCAHPMGPLRLTDLVGLDTTLHATNALYEEFRQPHFAPPTLLSRMVESGLLGRKSGRGFFEYA